MPAADPWLPTRLAREAAVRAGERRIESAALEAIGALLVAMKGVYDPTTGTLDTARMDANDPAWVAALDDVLLPTIGAVYEAAWLEAAEAVTVGRPQRESVVAAADFKQILMQADLSSDRYVTRHLMDVRNRLVGVPDHVFSTITFEIDQGRKAGEGIPELAGRVDKVLANTNQARWKNRATTIARTETIGAYNAGHLNGTTAMAEAYGIRQHEVVKEWLATADRRTRATHLTADGQQQYADASFIVGGFALDHPGDPSGPAREVVNCRCTLTFLLPGDPGYPAQIEQELPPADVPPPVLSQDWLNANQINTQDSLFAYNQVQFEELSTLTHETLVKGGYEAYTSTGYSLINRKLRGVDIGDFGEKFVSKTAPAVETWWQAAARPMPAATLFRGVRRHHRAIDTATPGKFIPEPAYMSATISKGTARDFAESGGWIMQLEVPAGIKAAVGHKGEREVVLGPGTNWKVIEVDHDKHEMRLKLQ